MNLLISIAYSGTRLIRDVVMAGQIDIDAHCNDIKMPEIREILSAQSPTIIVPIRHPINNAKSFTVRGYVQSQYDAEWRYMIDEIAGHGPNYIHVEEKDLRDKELEAVSPSTVTSWPRHPKVTSPIVEGMAPIKARDEYVDFYEQTLRAA